MNALRASALLAATCLTAAAATPPPTLLALTGAASAAGRLDQSVVLVIDAQREYVDGRLPLAGIHAALQETQRLLARARAAGVPVVHIQQISAAGRAVFAAGSRTTDFADEARPAPGEIVIAKTLPNAFAGTTLDETLHRLGRKEIIVTGYMTHMCVSATARSALDHGYHCTVVASACATRDLPDGRGGTIAAADVHRVALAELADRFATVVPDVDTVTR